MEILKSNKSGFRQYLGDKNLASRTQRAYLKGVETFFKWAQVEDIQITKPDILRYLEYLKNKGLQNITRNNHLIALNHYFTFLYNEEMISANPCLLLKIRGKYKKKLQRVYTPEELETLFDNFYQIFVRNYDNSKQRHEQQKQCSALGRERNAVMLSVLINQGANTNEMRRIETGDIDLIKATIKLRGGKRLNERILPLKATQIGLFLQYLQNTRPKLLEYQTRESDKLFLPLPAIGYKKTENQMNNNVFTPLATQLKSIDKQFINFTQIRSSVITFWVKSQGLRKAQYLAGHRNISGTEKYIANDLENLIEDINKMHPF